MIQNPLLKVIKFFDSSLCARVSLSAWVCIACCVSSLNAEAQRRIIGGEDAQVNDWPWVVSLENTQGRHFCGGTLIDAYWILSAAHCFDTFSASYRPGIRAAIGLHDRNNLADSELIQVERFIQHPYWDTHNYDNPNDIALLQLESPAQGPTIRLVQAGSALESAETLATALGWGLISLSPKEFPTILQQVEVPLVSLETCRQAYSPATTLIDSQICAGLQAGGKDACTGDSGGPLTVFDGQQWLQVGVTSFGGKFPGPICAGADAYGIYTKVSSFQSFVQNYVFSDISFESPTKIQAGEPWKMQLVEENTDLHPRPEVDLWVAVLLSEQFWFLSGSVQQPTLSLEAQPLLSNLSATENTHLLLDLASTNNMLGTYPIYAVLTVAGQGLTLEAMRSPLLQIQIEID